MLLSVCVPAERKAEIDDRIKVEDEAIWSEAGWLVFSRVIGSTIALAVGWFAHVLAGL